MKSLKISFALVAFITFSSSAFAQSTSWSIDASTHIKDGKKSSLVGIFPTHNFDSSAGIWGYAGLSPTWAELLAGPGLHTTISDTYIESGIGAGVEQYVTEATFTPRFATYAVVANDSFNAFGFLEYGEATGWWYLFQGLHTVAGPISAGIHGQRFVGVGPRVQLDIGPGYLWIARVADPEVSHDPWGTALGFGIRF